MTNRNYTGLLWIFPLLLLVTFTEKISRKPNILRKPNIVFVVSDDLGYQDVGFRGSNILTPHIDKLAKEGVILENHYVMPRCSPTRSSLLSGRYAIRTGFWKGNIKPNEEWGLRLNETLLPEMLKRNGYATHGIGKWHAGMYTWDHTPAKRGFDTFFGLYLGSQDYFTHKRVGHGIDFREAYHDKEGNFVERTRRDLTGQYSTNLFSDRAVSIIEQHDQTVPLFLYLAYTAPHAPNQAPLDQISKFTSNMSKKRRVYATKISIMDAGIGGVVECLKQKNMLENTIIVFTADNGAHFGNKGSNYPLRGGKNSLFEGGVRAVSFINSPLLNTTGYTNTNLHHVTDWYATFQKMAGDQPEKYSKAQLPIDGVDIWESVSNNKPCRDEVLMNLRDHKMVQHTSELEFLATRSHDKLAGKLADKLAGKLADKLFDREYLPLKYTLENTTVDNVDEGDVFVLRWRNWKLFHGTFLVQGWTKANNQGKDDLFNIDGSGRGYKIALGTGTLLFDLSKDPAEKRNLAHLLTEVVEVMLAKMEGYKRNMTQIHIKHRSEASLMGHKIKVIPWVTSTRVEGFQIRH